MGWYFVLGSSVDQNLLLWKACNIELGYNETVCDNLGDFEEEENEVRDGVQELLANHSGLRQAFVLKEVLDRKY